MRAKVVSRVFRNGGLQVCTLVATLAGGAPGCGNGIVEAAEEHDGSDDSCRFVVGTVSFEEVAELVASVVKPAACVPTSLEEVCDDVDNDCDGVVDEDLLDCHADAAVQP